MNKKSENKALRKGWTTGSCATAAATSAFSALLGSGFLDPVEIILPKGQRVAFALNRHGEDENGYWASVIKDAGDDPDVTHGAEIIVHLQKGIIGSGIQFKNGVGVGLVTKAGLPLAVGEPAINPVPRSMITQNLHELEKNCDVVVTISIPNGKELAEKTMNPRLGILGGLSILGTSGLVIPYSCAAWIHSIHRGIDVARAEGLNHIGAATGNMSEKALVDLYHFPESALIDMGDFAGGVLKYLRKNPVAKLSLCGGFAKFCKLAQGEFDLHSSRSRIDFHILRQWFIEAGGREEDAFAIEQANTALEVLEYSQRSNVDFAQLVARRAKEVAMAVLSGHCEVEVILVNRSGEIVAHVS